MTRRYTRNDSRRVRRMALLLSSKHIFASRMLTAAELDDMAEQESIDWPERWTQHLAEARHYLREMGRRSNG